MQTRWNYISHLGHYLMIFCFSSENSKFEVQAGGSSPLSIIVKMICKMCKNLNQYKILVYCDPLLMCNLTNKALARYLFFKMLESCLKNLENVNVGRLTAQFTKHFLVFIQCTRYCITGAILKN